MWLITVESQHFTWRASHSDRTRAEKAMIDFWNQRAAKHVTTIEDLGEIAEINAVELFDGFTEQR
jgi:hypothetical protein